MPIMHSQNKTTYDRTFYENALRRPYNPVNVSSTRIKNDAIYSNKIQNSNMNTISKKKEFFLINASKYPYSATNKSIQLKVVGASENDKVVYTGDCVVGDHLIYKNCGTYNVIATKQGATRDLDEQDMLTITILKGKVNKFQLCIPDHYKYNTHQQSIPLQVEKVDDEIFQNLEFSGPCVRNSQLHYKDVGEYEFFVTNRESQNYLSHTERFLIVIEKAVQNLEFPSIEWDYSPIRKKIILPQTYMGSKVAYSLIFPTDARTTGHVRLQDNILHFFCPNITICIGCKIENKNFEVTSKMHFHIIKTPVTALKIKGVPVHLLQADPHYSLTEISQVYSPRDLLSTGYSLRDLKDVEIPVLDVFETRKVSAAQLENAGFDMYELSTKLHQTYTVEQLLDQKRAKVEDLKVAGYTATELLESKKVSLTDLKRAGYPVKCKIR